MSAALYSLTWLISISLWFVGLLAQNGPTEWTVSPFNPPAFPLAVRSPYLNTWSFQGNDPLGLNNIWPDLWTFFGATTGWYASVIVDGQAYRLMGRANFANVSWADQTAAEFTPTRSSFLLTAGLMQINVSFISPIEPTDLVRQSMPFSYLTMSASSIDGNSHSLRMYSDVSGEFIAGDSSQLAQWTADVDDEHIILSIQMEMQKMYSELNNFAQDATEFYCFKMINETIASWAITNDTVNRLNAANASVTLGNTMQPSPRQFKDAQNNWTSLGIAVDWGKIQSTRQSAVWALGVVRSPSIQYASPSGIEDRFPYFMSYYSNATYAAKAFLDDFPRAQAVAVEFDSRTLAAGQQYSSEYADLLALSARQLLGSIDITISKDSEGNWNTLDVKVFMKNMGGIGSDQSGTTTSVNTVDTMYAAFPAFLYLNPELGGYLLSPLLECQDSPQYTLDYAAKNIGSAYPNATADGLQSPHDYGVEESANMLIMALAYSQKFNNGTLLSKHYALLQKWAQFLVNNSFQLGSQKSADFSTDSPSMYSNQTNLSLKGIIGIACMARIAEITGMTGDVQRFKDLATSFVSQWTQDAVPSDQSTVYFSFRDSNSNGLIYNLYADILLELNLLPSSVYEAVTTSYTSLDGQSTYGRPLDNSQKGWTTTNWMMFAASTVNSDETRDSMVKQIHAYAASSHNNTPFSSTYDPSTGLVDSSKPGTNSPAVGAMFSLLVINTTSAGGRTNTSGTGSPTSTKSHTDAGAIAGGTIGGFFAALVIAYIGLAFLRRRRQRREEFEEETKANPVILPPARVDFHLYSPQVAPLDKTFFRPSYTEVELSASTSSPSSSRRPFLQMDNRQTATSPSQLTSEGFGTQSTQDSPAVISPDRLREDVVNLRRDLDRLRLDLSNSREESLPSYSDPGRS